MEKIERIEVKEDDVLVIFGDEGIDLIVPEPSDAGLSKSVMLRSKLAAGMVLMMQDEGYRKRLVEAVEKKMREESPPPASSRSGHHP